MKRTYPIREWKAIEKFRSHLSNDPGTIQMLIPLAEIAQLLRQGVSQLLHETEKRLLLTIILLGGRPTLSFRFCCWDRRGVLPPCRPCRGTAGRWPDAHAFVR